MCLDFVASLLGCLLLPLYLLNDVDLWTFRAQINRHSLSVSEMRVMGS